MDDSAVRLVKRCLSEGMTVRQEQTEYPNPFYKDGTVDNPWGMFDDAYHGRYTKHMGRLPTHRSRPVDELAFGIVERMTTALTDNRPKCAFVPAEPGDFDRARIVQGGFDYWWNKERCASTDALAVKDSRKFGVGWYYLRWDSKRKSQVLECVHPEQIWVSPDAVAQNYDPSWIVYEYMAQVGDLVEAFGVNPEDIKSNWLSDSGVSVIDRVLKFFGSQSNVTNPATSVPVYELWIRDPDTVVWEEDMGDTVVKKRKMKYPGGRVIRVCGGVELIDKKGANPYDHGEFPFIPIFAAPESDKFYCRGDIELILSSVVIINKYDQMLIDQTVRQGGAIVLTNPITGVDKDQITNDPVQVINTKDVNNAVRMLTFPAPSRHIVDHAMTIRSKGQDAVGWHDISQGKYTPGNKTAQEIGALVESDQTRVRMASKWHAWALEKVGRQWLSNARQFGDFKWIVRVTEDSGEQRAEVFDSHVLQDLELDLTVDDFSMLPDTLQERKQLAKELFAQGVIDPEELLKTLEWPNYQAVIARMTKSAQAPAVGPAGPPDASGGPVSPDMGPAPTDMGAGPQMPPDMMAQLAAMMQGSQAPQMAGPSMMPQGIPPEVPNPAQDAIPGPDVPDTADPMAVMQQIADANGVTVEEVLAKLGMGGQPPPA
jgi:hypothetical protein